MKAAYGQAASAVGDRFRSQTQHGPGLSLQWLANRMPDVHLTDLAEELELSQGPFVITASGVDQGEDEEGSNRCSCGSC